MKLAEDLRRAVLQAAIEGSLTGGSCEGWRFVRLDEIGEIIGGGTPDTSKSEYWTNGRIAWITPADMGTLKSKYISHGARNITEKGLASSSARMMPKGSIIFSSRAPIGYVAIAENGLCTNQGCKSVRLYDEILSEYVYFALLAMRDDIKKMGSGTTFKEISGTVFSSVIIPLPPIDEQHRIVSRLDAILPLIAELEAAEDELEALERRFPGDMRDALLQAAIEGRLTGSNTDNWRQVRLGDISSYGEPVTKVSAKNIPANSWLLDLEDIEKGGRILRHRTAQETKSTGEKAIFHKGDILFSKLRPYLQKVVIAPSDGYCTPELIPFHCFGEIIPQYIVYFLKAPSINYTINSESYGVKMPRVGTKTMKNLLVLLPPINEQHKIVSCLNELLPLCEAIGETVYDA